MAWIVVAGGVAAALRRVVLRIIGWIVDIIMCIDCCRCSGERDGGEGRNYDLQGKGKLVVGWQWWQARRKSVGVREEVSENERAAGIIVVGLSSVLRDVERGLSVSMAKGGGWSSEEGAEQSNGAVKGAEKWDSSSGRGRCAERRRALRGWLPRIVERTGSAAEECLYQMEVVNVVVTEGGEWEIVEDAERME